jgi:hypothetical protein
VKLLALKRAPAGGGRSVFEKQREGVRVRGERQDGAAGLDGGRDSADAASATVAEKGCYVESGIVGKHQTRRSRHAAMALARRGRGKMAKRGRMHSSTQR